MVCRGPAGESPQPQNDVDNQLVEQSVLKMDEWAHKRADIKIVEENRAIKSVVLPMQI